ncbi:hypothetical protein [Jiangella alkaliphila]|uniref:hypothetical protein n=1 Tax=Jiangella alkaliphila TaxID=419479 RepID=UPI001F373E6B|nr:hypothetical protein [Jiangella alkaliphila]
MTTWTSIVVDGVPYVRTAVPTRWFTAADDLHATLLESLPLLERGDTVVVSEKVAVFLTGRAVPIDAVQPGRLAHLLARAVRPRPGSRGLSVPEKMQFVVAEIGRPRVIVAALLSALTRPFGFAGVFYRVAGPVARDVDGGRPPYEHLVFPPLTAGESTELCADLEAWLGVGVAIVDLNDYGGTVRGVSPQAAAPGVLLAVLAGNLLGQRSTSTPFGIVRRLSDR